KPDVLRGQAGGCDFATGYAASHASHPDGEWTYQLLMGVNGKFDGITRDDLMAVAKRFGVVGARDALAQVREAVGSWTAFADAAGLPEVEARVVAADHRPA